MLLVNYTIKCNRKTKRSSYESLVECNHHKNKKPRGDTYELQTSQHRSAQLYTKILCRRAEFRKIAQLIGRSPSTVSREIRRNCTHMYDIPTNYPHTAQKKYLLRRSYCHRGMFRSQAAIEYRNEKLKAAWSPEQIACTPCGLKMPSWRTIYRWIYEKYLVNGNLKVLRRKGKSHGVKETRGKYNKGKSMQKALCVRILCT